MTSAREGFSHDTSKLGSDLDSEESMCYEIIDRMSRNGPIDLETIARQMLHTSRPTSTAVADVIDIIDRVSLKLGETGLVRTTDGYQSRRALIGRKIGRKK